MADDAQHAIEVTAIMDRLQEVRDLFADTTHTRIAYHGTAMPFENRAVMAQLLTEILEDWAREKAQMDGTAAATVQP